MSMTESPDAIVGPSRTFKYEPSVSRINDPMKFGAYRRWKEAGGDQSSSVVSKPRPKGVASNSKKGKKKGKGSFNSDSFFDAIKDLGKGGAPNIVSCSDFFI